MSTGMRVTGGSMISRTNGRFRIGSVGGSTTLGRGSSAEMPGVRTATC